MTALDIAFGFLAGIVSCVTPAALLLFPLVFAAAGADGRAGRIAPAVGLGLSLVLTGLVAGSLGMLLGLDAVWFRRIVCGILVLVAVALMSPSTVERHPLLLGSVGSPFDTAGERASRGAFRLLLLALLVGANWIPLLGPTLGKASLMAADIWNSHVALAVLFAFGLGAAVPWIVLGRVLGLLTGAFASGLVHGMAGKRLLAFTLFGVAILGSTGLDFSLAHWLGPVLPPWTGKLALTF